MVILLCTQLTKGGREVRELCACSETLLFLPCFVSRYLYPQGYFMAGNSYTHVYTRHHLEKYSSRDGFGGLLEFSKSNSVPKNNVKQPNTIESQLCQGI